MKAAFLAVGSELLGADRLDTNSTWIAGRLDTLGLTLAEKQVVGDGQAEIADRLRDLAARFDLVLVSGGLGPTLDDCTKEAAAEAFGRHLHRDAAIVARIAERFARRGLTMPEINAKQGDVPDGAEVIPNAVGTAPGFFLVVGSAWVVLMPGVPSEMKPQFDDWLAPRLAERLGAAARPRRTRTLRLTGLPESDADQRARGLYRRFPEEPITILAGGDEVVFQLRAREPEADARLDEMEAAFREEFGERIFGRDGDSMESVVLDLLRARGETLAIAESCTGGAIAARLTEIPGASDVFLGGLVTYANAAKTRDAGVAHADLERFGAVSDPVARQLASGVRARFGTSWGLGVTGIAGPTGGSDEKPVGTVFIAIAGPTSVFAERLHLLSDRRGVRRRAGTALLDRLRLALLAP